MKPLRLAIVDDSTFVRKALCRIMEAEPSIRVVGAAASGEELLANLGTWRPEAITLDLSMPGMDGLATLDRIMAWKNVPVIILSTHSRKDAPLTIEALHRGAMDFVDKQQYSLVDFGGLRKVLVEKILQVTRRAPPSPPLDSSPVHRVSEKPPAPVSAAAGDQPYDLILIGASTGGPPAIQQILQRLGHPLPVPVVVVQHMPEGFTTAFANRLNAHLPFPVSEPAPGEVLRSGSVYIAAAGTHLLVGLSGDDLVTARRRFPDKVPHRPSIDVLFRSVAEIESSDVRALAILLTGMGKDGAEGLAELARSGAYTIGQNEATCVVYGMPKVAKELGAVREELPLPAIARRVNELLSAELISTGTRAPC